MDLTSEQEKDFDMKLQQLSTFAGWIGLSVHNEGTQKAQTDPEDRTGEEMEDTCECYVTYQPRPNIVGD